MAEQTFKSPGFFEREIEVISRPLISNRETPVGIVGPAEKGPAFVPVTVSSDTEFFKIFGHPDRYRYPAHAASEFFLEGGKALTFCRVLGLGLSSADGDAKHAGFKVNGVAEAGRADSAQGAVQFILANHTLNDAEHITLGLFNDNDSHTTSMDTDPSDGVDNAAGIERLVQLVRAVVFLKEGYSLRISPIAVADDFSSDVVTSNESSGEFKLQVTDGNGDNTTFTVSLDPLSDKYLTKVLNTDSFSFTDKGHYLYADFPVDDVVASSIGQHVAVARGKDDGNLLDAYGDFNARYSSPQSPMFISQPFGKKEYELFRFESLDDGSYASGKYKVSIVNLKASTEKNYKFGTFGVQLRDLNDTDDNPVVYEAYSNLSLDPNADNFIAKVIGDQRIKLSLDVDSEDEKRLIREGTYPAKSTRIRVVVSDDVLSAEAPEEALPFGFRGIPALFTTDGGLDGGADGSEGTTLIQYQGQAGDVLNTLDKPVLPPLPYRMKVTKGRMSRADSDGSDSWFQTYLGEANNNSETVKTFFYWGLMTTRVGNINDPNSATSSDISMLTHNLTKFLGASSAVVKSEGSAADKFNNNKFSLAKVAFAKKDVSNISSSVLSAFKEVVYVRNADADNPDLYDPVLHEIKMNASANDPFTGEDGGENELNLRASIAKLLAEDVVKFNKFSLMTKFTAPFYGGFDGVNILDEDDYYFTDRAASTVEAAESADGVPGHAADGGYSSGLSGTSEDASVDSIQGYGLDNNAIVSYKNGIKLMTDEMVTTANVLVVPGIRENLVTDYAAARVKEYGKAIYLMDVPHFNAEPKRIFTSAKGIASGRPDVDETSAAFDLRELNSSYVATYFPDVTISDRGDDDDAAQASRRSIKVPSSIVALGSLARTDRAGTPWFAPAGFSRGSLSRVKSLDVRLSAGDRDTLYEARLNPIANFPNNQFVIFGQKTTQIARTALDRVNVRRLMIRIKSDIQKIAQGLLFEQNDAPTRQRFIDQASNRLQQIRIGQGIEDFRVIMDGTNNTEEDVDNNRLNGRIIVVPTRAIEFIAMDFVITNSGVEFPA
jgi:hypothetical protein